jgi:fatty acid desaturase
MFDVFDGVIRDTRTLLTAAIGVVAIWFVAWTWFRTKALVPTLGALLVSAVVIFGVTNFSTLTDRIEHDVDTRYGGSGGGGGRRGN